MKRMILPLAALIPVLLAGCNSDPAEGGAPGDPQYVAGQAPAVSANGDERDVATRAIDALAAHLGIAKAEILVDTVRAVEWPDSSVGCPQPDQAYLQVITPGHKITLRAKGQIHVVHEARGHAFVCVQTKPVGGVTAQYELVFGAQLLEARKELAQRLGVSEDEIDVESAQEASWDDAGLGCPESGVSYAKGPVSGWVLKLEHRSRDYTFHTDLKRTIPCPPITAE